MNPFFSEQFMYRCGHTQKLNCACTICEKNKQYYLYGKNGRVIEEYNPYDELNPNLDSLWYKLPNDIIFHIFSYVTEGPQRRCVYSCKNFSFFNGYGSVPFCFNLMKNYIALRASCHFFRFQLNDLDRYCRFRLHEDEEGVYITFREGGNSGFQEYKNQAWIH